MFLVQGWIVHVLHLHQTLGNNKQTVRNLKNTSITYNGVETTTSNKQSGANT
jgi:hypothetical protein